jgi:hypothetical protein
MRLVPQRPQHGQPEFAIGDCNISAIATHSGRTYEQIAKVLGFEIDPETGLPISEPWPNTHQHTLNRLRGHGFQVSDFPPSGLAAAPHISAVVGIEMEWEGKPAGHAVVYRDGLLFDLRYPKKPGMPIKDAGKIISAFTLEPLSLGDLLAVHSVDQQVRGTHGGSLENGGRLATGGRPPPTPKTAHADHGGANERKSW